MLHRVEAVEARPKHRVWLRFADGLEGEIDLSELAGKGVFASSEDPAEFAKVFVDEDTGTIAWPGGIDLAPDALYQELAGIGTR